MRPLALALWMLVPQAALAAPPVIVEACCPGFSPQEIEQTVAVPLESVLQGTAGVAQISALSLDGRCLVRLDLDARADRLKVRQDVARRVATAAPSLPAECARPGVKLLPDADDACELLALWSTDGLNLGEISALARDLVRPRLLTVPGVAEVAVLGDADGRWQIALEPERLAARGLAVTDVISPLQRAAAGERPVAAQGPLRPADLEDVVVGTANGQPVRLKDVARLEQSDKRQVEAGVALRDSQQGGKIAMRPALLAAVRPAPGSAKAVEKALGSRLDDVRANLPSRLHFQRHTCRADDLAVVLRVPSGANLDRKAQLARQAAEAVLGVAQVQAVFWRAGQDDDTTLLVSLAPGDRGADPRPKLRAALARLPQAAVRVGRMRLSGTPWPGDGMAIVVRVRGDDLQAVSAAAADLRQRMGAVPGVVDLDAGASDEPRLSLHIDRQRAGQLGVSVADVAQALQTAVGGLDLGGGKGPGRAVLLTLGGEAGAGRPAGLAAIRLRAADGRLVLLRDLATIEQVAAPTVIYRSGGGRCRVVSANVQGRSEAEVRADLQAIAREASRQGIRVELAPQEKPSP